MAKRVKVTVDPYDAARWVAMCHEPGCTWTQSPDAKTYVEQLARAHRRQHREAADRG